MDKNGNPSGVHQLEPWMANRKKKTTKTAVVRKVCSQSKCGLKGTSTRTPWRIERTRYRISALITVRLTEVRRRVCEAAKSLVLRCPFSREWLCFYSISITGVILDWEVLSKRTSSLACIGKDG